MIVCCENRIKKRYIIETLFRRLTYFVRLLIFIACIKTATVAFRTQLTCQKVVEKSTHFWILFLCCTLARRLLQKE